MTVLSPYVIALIAGSLCLPATYVQTRHGEFWVSLAIIIFVGASAAMVAAHYMRKTAKRSPWWTFPIAFTSGSFITESFFIIGYNSYYGWDDPKLAVGFAVALIEATVISIFGAGSFAVGQFLIHRITSTSRATP